jgi:hypothetical protein
VNYPPDSNKEAKPIIVVGDHEYDLPERHCDGEGEVLWFERWDDEKASYRCDLCYQRFRLRHTKGWEPPLGSFYD